MKRHLIKQCARLMVITICLTSLYTNNTIAQLNWQRTNPGGGGACSMITETANGTLLLGSDLSGVYKSTDNGQSWTVLGATQGLTPTHITCLAPHYTDGNTFYIGTDRGIFKSTNGGNSVYQTNTEIVQGVGYIECLEMSSNNANIGFAATHEWWEEKLTFLRTWDGGENWFIIEPNGLPWNASIVKMMSSRNNSEIIFALTGKARYRCSEPWLYKSTDGGYNWTRLAIGISPVLDFDLHPYEVNTLYASSFTGADCSQPVWSYFGSDPNAGAVYKSTNGGFNFSQIGDATGFIRVGFNPDEISVVNFLFSGDPSAGTWKTYDGGSNWTKTGNLSDWTKGWPVLNYAYTSSFYGLAKTVSRSMFDQNKINAAFGGYAWISNDGGDTFTNVATNEVSPGKHLSTGMDNINGNSIDVSDINPNVIYVGYYDLGFWYSKNHGNSWTFSIPNHEDFPNHVWWGNGGSNANFVLNDPARENVVWSTFGTDNSSTQGAIFKSTEYGENWQWSNNGLQALGLNTHGMSIDVNSPVNNRILFVTQNGNVYRSADDGNNWTMVLNNGGLKFTAVDRWDSQIVYAGGENGFWRSTNGGSTWAEVGLPEMRYQQQNQGSTMRDDIVPTNSSPGLEAWEGVFEIKVDLNEAYTVYVTAYGKGKGFYKSTDAGITWTKLYTNDYMRGIAIDPNRSSRLFISSSKSYHSGGYEADAEGILYSENGGLDWQAVNNGMSWTFGGRMEIENSSTPHIWAWVPGTGVQYAAIEPSITLAAPNIILKPNQIEMSSTEFTDNLIIGGDFSNYTIKVLDTNGQIVEDYTNPSNPLIIDTNTFGEGLHFISIKHTQHAFLYVVKFLR